MMKTAKTGGLPGVPEERRHPRLERLQFLISGNNEDVEEAGLTGVPEEAVARAFTNVPPKAFPCPTRGFAFPGHGRGPSHRNY